MKKDAKLEILEIIRVIDKRGGNFWNLQPLWNEITNTPLVHNNNNM